MPCYLPVMSYADNRALRATLHRAYATRASDLGASPAWDNAPVIPRILELRHEAARLLGYANFAEVSLVPKMAASVDEVLAFLRDLARRAKPFAERDYAELAAFARDELGLADLAPWDLAYASEKLKAKRFAFSEQEVRRYFPEDKVLAGLFRVAETLYGISIRESRAPTWHPDVRFFDIDDAAGALIGQFYLDIYARARQAGRRVDGRRDQPPARRRAGPASGRVPHLQPVGAGRRQARDVHARRGDHALPRVRPRPAPAAHARRGRRRFRHPGRRMGCRRAPEPVHGELLLGVGRARADDARTSTPASRCRARCSTGCSRRGISRAASRRSAISSSACSTCCCTRPTTPAAATRRRPCSTPCGARSPSCRGRLRSLHAIVRAHLRRRLRGWILQLQVGRGAFGGRVQPPSRKRGVLSPATGERFRDEVLARGGSRDAHGVVRRVSRARAPTRRPSAA